MTVHLTTTDHETGPINANGPLPPPERQYMKATESSNLPLNTLERHDEDLAIAGDKLDARNCHIQTAKWDSVIMAEQFPLGIVERTEENVSPEEPDSELRLVKGTAGKNVESIADEEANTTQIDLTASPAPENSRAAEVEKVNQLVPRCQAKAENERKRTISEVSEAAAARQDRCRIQTQTRRATS
jgi:hypothetical protein